MTSEPSRFPDPDDLSETDIAIVGMAGRFPGAFDPDELWNRVRHGDDCLVDLSADELAAKGVPASTWSSPDYVRRTGVVDAVDEFDPGFFGIGKRDAAIMDPQHRLFIECVWEALESSGHTPEGFGGSIGLFGGSGMNTYLLNNLLTNPNILQQLGWFLLRHTSNDKDFLTTTASYRLGLHGPSVNVQTACSTSLVALHLAAQSLLSFECDMALAGGVTLEFPHGVGYEYREGEVLSPDGHCRAFDERSGGTVLTGGVAVVALRRLTDAYADGDPILAVVKGSAINNDGARKVGYLAPSVDGHADVVKEALAVSGIDPRTIGLLEAHGTGTAVGDPIEVAALTEAFRSGTPDVGFCRLVSTKPNIGHLDTAAGTASVIKVVQALRHRILPPLANHTAPSPLMGIETTPFVVSGTEAPWESTGPRRAGISSLGVGGTNAHVIVEEAPEYPPTPEARGEQLLVLSGQSRDAVKDGSQRLAAFLEAEPDTNLADVGHTLLAGRRAMQCRRVVTAPDTAGAAELLRSNDRRRTYTAEVSEETPGITFMFPGGGAQYVGMGAGLDERFEVFHQIRSEGAEIVRAAGGPDLTDLFGVDVDDEALRRATASLPAVFITSVALARQWMAWGVEPDSMIGHSLGEYVAAHLAGVLSFEDALALVINRSILIENVSGDDAAMLVVPLAESDVVARLPEALSLATVNAEDECVVAGPAAVVTEFNAALAEDDVVATLIPIAAAGHSSMLDPILDAFQATVESVTLNAPERRYLSNLTGTWITAEQATDPKYWVQHLRRTVRFHDCVSAVLDEGPTVFVELGPGQSLSSYVRRTGQAIGAISSLRHPNDDVDDTAFTMNAFARIWAHGIDVDLTHFAGQQRRRLRLPTYAFQRERFFIEPGEHTLTTPSAASLSFSHGAETAAGPTRIESIDDMFWVPSWEPAPELETSTRIRRWILVGDGSLADSVLEEMTGRGLETVQLSSWPDDEALLDDQATTVVVFGPSVSTSSTSQTYESSLRRWLHDAPTAVRALASTNDGGKFVAVTVGAMAVDGGAVRPDDALALGVVLTAPGEYPSVSTALVDLDPDRATSPSDLVDELIGAEGVVARRGDRRLTNQLTHTPVATVSPSGFEHRGTYVVTGGLGGIGYEIATHLASEYQANLILVSSRAVPIGEERERYVQQHSFDDPTCRRIRHVEALEHLGVKVSVVAADTADPQQVREALDDAERQAGPLTGAVHAAGRLRDRLLETATFDDHEYVVAPKARGALVLAEELQRRGANLLVLISSTSTYLAPGGQTSYVAANAVLDALAGQREQLRVATLNYGVWAGVGIAADVARRQHLGLAEGTPIDHPVFSEIATTRHGETELSGRLSTSHQWIVDQHRSETGVAVLPGTGHLQLLLNAAEQVGLSPARLDDVVLLEPLVVPDERPVTVRVVVGADDGAARSIRIDSDGGGRREWTTHSEATVSAGVDDRAPDTDIDALFARLGLDDIDPLETPRSHLQLGDRWDCLVDARRSDAESAGRLRMTQPSEAEAWSAHPGLVDVATAFGVILATGSAVGKLAVPIGYDRVTQHQPVPADCIVHARRQHHSTDEVLRVDIDLLTESGEIALHIDGLQLHPIDDPSALGITLEHHDTSGGGAQVAPLLALADGLGFHTDDGMAVLERLVATDYPRLVVSTVDLEGLLTPVEDAPSATAPTETGGSSATTVEAAISSMWTDLLGVAEIAGDDDFFDLGGHSLIAIRLMTRIHRELGVRFQLATIFEASTVDDLAALVRSERPDIDSTLAASAATSPAEGASAAPMAPVSEAPRQPMKHLIPISTKGDKAPLFIVHGAGGNVLFLWSLARAMAGDRPIYGFQAHGIDGADLPDASVSVMAERYAAELRAQHEGPYLLGGYSGGGVVTLEMAKILQAQGETVRFVFLFDSVPSGRAWPCKRDRRRNLVGNIRRHGYDRVHPYLREQLLTTVRKFVPERAESAAVHEADDRALGYSDVDTQGFVNLFFYFSATAERHPTGVYDVDAAVLKADLVWPYQPEDYYWTDHITGDLTLRQVPGDHHSMFYPENAPRLAEVMLELLERIDREDRQA